MAAVPGVAGATGRVARPRSRSLARRPPRADAVALRLRQLHGYFGGALGGGAEGEDGHGGALHGNQL